MAQLTGLTIEIVQEIQKRVGNNDKIQVVPWARGIDKINNNPNTLLFSMARTQDREDAYQWIGPIMANIYGLYAKSDSNLRIHEYRRSKTTQFNWCLSKRHSRSDFDATWFY